MCLTVNFTKMGQNSEDMLDGTTCSYCGQFFMEPDKVDENDNPILYTHGYPVVCEDCYDPQDQTYPKSLKPTL